MSGLVYRGHVTSIKVTFDTYGHLFPRRGAEASGRFEKSMEEARVKSNADVSNRGEEQGPRRRNQLKTLVAGDCNAPNALTLPFRLELSASC